MQEKDEHIIVHSLPYNPEVCGGIKVHYQLAMLEAQLGYSVFIVYDHDSIPEVSWFDHSCKEMTVAAFQDYLTVSGEKVFLLIGYEEPSSLEVVDAQHKVAYIQNQIYYQEGKYKDAYLWFIGNYCKESCEKKEGESKEEEFQYSSGVDIVPPYLSSIFTSNSSSPSLRDEDNKKDKYKLLIQERKQGEEAWQEISKLLPKEVLDKIEVNIHKNSNEKEFAMELHNSDIFIAHSYPEGFNLPPLEAMALGTVVIGYTGGGGSGFMNCGDRDNCLIAEDGDTKMMAENIINFVLNFSPENIFGLKLAGKCTVITYNAFVTFKILCNILKGYHNDN